jgi:hypothetical protein
MEDCATTQTIAEAIVSLTKIGTAAMLALK